MFELSFWNYRQSLNAWIGILLKLIMDISIPQLYVCWHAIYFPLFLAFSLTIGSSHHHQGNYGCKYFYFITSFIDFLPLYWFHKLNAFASICCQKKFGYMGLYEGVLNQFCVKHFKLIAIFTMCLDRRDNFWFHCSFISDLIFRDLSEIIMYPILLIRNYSI